MLGRRGWKTQTLRTFFVAAARPSVSYFLVARVFSFRFGEYS